MTSYERAIGYDSIRNRNRALMVAYKGVKTVTMYDKRWTLEQHFDDLEKKKLALRKMTEHHEEEAAKSRLRERQLVLTHLSMVNDIINDLWWEIGELQDSLENRDSILYVKNQVDRNEAWSKWVELKQERIRLFKIHRELMECL